MSIVTPISSWGGTLARTTVNEDTTLTLLKPETPHYLVLPLYITMVDNSVLDKEFFEGYKIISIKDFHKNYIDKLFDHDNLLHSDVVLPRAGMVVNRPSARYVLMKDLGVVPYGRGNEIKEEALISSEIAKLDLFISALRLLSTGSIYINRIYFLSDATHSNRVLKTSTSLYDIHNYYSIGREECYFWEQYNLNADILEKTSLIMERLSNISERFWLPLSYFNQYHSSYDLTDKLSRPINKFYWLLAMQRCSGITHGVFWLVCKNWYNIWHR